MFAAIVYLLCLIASALCALLLVRSYARHRTRLLLWSAACFLCLALNNLLVVVDVLLLPTQVDLRPVRALSSLGGVVMLLYGFIFELD
jgi:hypothetical protein